MAQHKKSFILYADLLHTVSRLPDDKAGELFKLILSYVNDENPDLDSLDLVIGIAFEPIRQQLKRDLNKWGDKREKRAEAGRLGGLAKASNAKQKVANVAVNDNVNVNDNVTVNVIKKNIPALEDFLSYALEKKPDVNQEAVKLKYESWIVNGWKDGNNKPIKNWKSKLLNTLPYLKDEATRTNNKRGFKSDSSQQAADAIMQRIQSKAGNGNSPF